jgi:hypothetical protein
MEKDDNTLDNAGPVGRELADTMSQKMIEVIDGFPASGKKQQVAIARIFARNLDDYADELER